MSALTYVKVKGSLQIHAQLAIDASDNRTACGRLAGDETEEPPSGQRCEACWLDWRVRRELARPRIVQT